jgi:hypothetical protein
MSNTNIEQLSKYTWKSTAKKKNNNNNTKQSLNFKTILTNAYLMAMHSTTYRISYSIKKLKFSHFAL